MASPVYPSTVG